MAIAMPTGADVQALYGFLLKRANEEWAAINSDEELELDAAGHFYRVSNSNKHAITCTAEGLLALLDHGHDEQITRAWHLMTGAGEQWRDHDDFLPRWENPQLSEVRRQLEG